MSELHGLIFDIRKFSLHDGPGIRTTVFMKGCPLSCWWCHNPESQSPAREVMLWEGRCIRCGKCLPTCAVEAIAVEATGVEATVVEATAVEAAGMEESQPSGLRYTTDRDTCTVCGECIDVCAAEARELVGQCMTVAEVMRQIERDVIFFDESGGGVTFSGGEPLAQRAFLAELLKACKALGIHTAVDTSGYTPWKALDSIRADTDLFLYDLKLMDDARHRQFTGVPNGLILHNLRALCERGARVILRVPIIPGLNDDARNLNQLAEFAADLPHLERVDILPYHPSALGKYERLGKPYHLADTRSPSDEHMQEIAHLLEQQHLIVKIGG